MADTLTRRALNRALLARQLLLTRADLDPLTAVEHLVGLQAQAPHPPYIGLWSRLRDFAFTDLAHLITDRALVRILLMRGTIHLVSARDCHGLRPLIQPVLNRGLTSTGELPEHVLPAILAAARTHLAERALTAVELAALLAPHFPHDPAAMAAAARARLPLIQVPPRGLWGRSGPAAHTLADTWLGPPPAATPTIDQTLLRYLAAFGPATPADAQAWSGLTGLREVFDRLPLRTFTDPAGRTLHDLPDAPRPDPDTPAPARYLTHYDNLLLSHADRTRVITDEHRRTVITKNGIVHATILVDGHVAGTWRITRTRTTATLTVTPFTPLTTTTRDDLTTEGHHLLTTTDPDTTHDIHIP